MAAGGSIDPAEKLRRTLEQLHAQLPQVRQADPEVHRLLETALGDIQSALAQRSGATEASPAASPDEEGSITHQLQTAAQRFEATHPTLAGFITSVIDALGQMGI